MKRKYRSAFIAAYILVILAGVIWQAGGASAETTIKLTVNSHTTSTATMNNMKPGDKMHSEYTILNEGNEGFNYFVDFKFISGDVELYDILQMTLEKEGVIIYSGVMSEAAGRVSIGSLAGGEQSTLLMDVTFPWEAGNEYQGKATTVAFEFSASGEPEPTTTPEVTPSPTATLTPTVTPIPTVTPEASASPTANTSPEATVSPTATTTIPAVIVTPGQSSAPAPLPTPSATTVVGEISITEPPVPLGGPDNGSDNVPSAAPSNGSDTSSTTPEPSDEINVPDDELPLGAPEAGDKLPDTAEPWYNLILGSLAIAVISIIVMRRLKSKR